MRGPHRLFGSHGPRQHVFGRKGIDQPVSRPVDQPVFGKRRDAATRPVSLQKERLRGFASELQLIFADTAFPDAPLPFHLQDDGDPVIVFRPPARLCLDPGTGAFVFVDESGASSSTLISADADRIMEAVVSHLAKTQDAAEPGFEASILGRCVGRTVAEIERGLIIATLRQCPGNRPLAAHLLGLSLRTLRSKLRSYWSENLPLNALTQGSTAGDCPPSGKNRDPADRQRKSAFPANETAPTAASRRDRED